MSEDNETEGNGTEEKVDQITEDVVTEYGSDSSTVEEVRVIVSEEDGDFLQNMDVYVQLRAYPETVAKDDSKSIDEKIEAGLSITRSFFSNFNVARHACEGSFTAYAIELGKVLITLKKLVKEKKEKWGDWAAENLKFMSERTRQNYMLLAEREDAHAFTYLGEQRLLHLISATSGIEGDDRIGEFLKSSGIEFDPEGEVKIQEFKNQVDAAIAVAKAKKVGVDVDLNKIKNLVGVGKTPDNQLIRDLSLVQKSGGNPNNHLDRLFMNKGQEEDIFEPQKRVESFIKLAAKMRSTINIIVKHTELADMIEGSQIDSLEEKISELRTFIANH